MPGQHQPKVYACLGIICQKSQHSINSGEGNSLSAPLDIDSRPSNHKSGILPTDILSYHDPATFGTNYFERPVFLNF